jgi:hypothetical protein
MSSYRFNGPGFHNEARRLLRERLQREEMGDEAYDRMIAKNDDGAFKKFGIFFIVAFGAVVLGVAWLGW